MNRKLSNERHHAKKRALMRFGLTLNRNDLGEIVQMILHNKSIPIRKQSNRVSIHRIFYKGIRAKVAYDKKRQSIITFMYG
jgi:hypothetical protein